MNAHSWAMLLPTSAAAVTMRETVIGGQNKHVRVKLDTKIMMCPWKRGLPVLIVDCTMTAELYPRSWDKRYFKSASYDYARNTPCANAIKPLDATFHRVLRNGYTPYGVVAVGHGEVSAGQPVYEVYWYSMTGEGVRYGTPTVDAFRLPHTPPPGFTTESPPPSSVAHTIGEPWLLASVVPTADEIRALRPAILQMHPVRPAPAPTYGDVDMLMKHLGALRRVASVTMARPPPRKAPWSEPPRTIAVRYGDAIDPDNLDVIISNINAPMYAHVQAFWGEEPQLWLTPR